MLFDFFDMANDYEQRKVANDVVNGATIDTAAVNDSTQPYETGVHCERYADRWIIVEQYDTKAEAEEGHKRWVALFTKGLPEKLVDVSECEINQMRKAFSGINTEEFLLKPEA